jgi:GAF domain-containing protein
MQAVPTATFVNKKQAYKAALQALDAILEGERHTILKMATINSVLTEHLPYCFWVGFYCMHHGQLMVGPYQGTLGCLHIPLSKGICGRAASTGKTQIVQDVHADPAHLACDSRTNSEIVVPVRNQAGQLIAVLDLDSTETAAFDDTDRAFLERLVQKHFAEAPLEMTYKL